MLLVHEFLKRYEAEDVNVAAWFAQAMNHCEVSAPSISTPTNFLTRRFTPPPPSPVSRRHAPSPLHHHRSYSETTNIYHTNGENYTSSGRFSPFRGDTPPLSSRFNSSPPPPDWDRSRALAGSVLSSPLSNRKRYTSEVTHPHGNTSPLVLQRYFHQQSQHHSPQSHFRSTSVSPCRHYTSENTKAEDSSNGGVKKRFSSFVKLQVGGGLPPTGPPHSPEPPPRHNRASPLLFRRHGNYIESVSPITSPSPVRRVFPESNSPSLPRRYVQPSPPQPPPRRLSECSSVPGSPQHSQHRPARFHHTPEPQRRVWAGPDLNDL
uniref:Uncharacterized protein n=2 Tax=Clastoptera arizonana TaxID=38151 RepID=A0A1B6CC85_9HEMI